MEPNPTLRSAFRACATRSLMLLMAALCLLTACHDDEYGEQPGSQKARRTVLVYMAAQNSLGRYRYHTSDSLEIMQGRQFIGDNDRMLMFIDDARAPRLYRVTRQRPEPLLVKQWATDFCSTNPENFRSVLELMRDSFPAEEYGLVMWSHADGWMPSTDTDYEAYEEQPQTARLRPFSFGIDSGPQGNMSNNGAQMSVEDMAEAISGAGLHLKYVFFDACLMQNLETDYALREVTDYVVASPIATPAAGSYYTHELEKGFFSDDPADIARTYLADVQAPELSDSYDNFGLVISCVRTDKLQPLADALADALTASTLMGGQSPDMTDVLAYQTYTYSYYYRPHNYDARQALCAILPATHRERVLAALDEAVTYHGATQEFWRGTGYSAYVSMPLETDDYRSVSLFVPQAVYSRNAAYTPHGDLNESYRRTAWYEAIGMARTGW